MLCHHFYHCANSSQVPCLHHREGPSDLIASYRRSFCILFITVSNGVILSPLGPVQCIHLELSYAKFPSYRFQGTGEKAIIGENTMRASAMDSGDANFWECSSRQLRLARSQ
ncbi:uncharacterized protein LOC142564146 [Dermacentor variabilis]|uniref:uncharacterized protein LOC142564146 n=1 Tax=Dermacentor variabilis TaxID=34621 RepID=UPI003F5C4366